MKIIENKTFDQERAFYGEHGIHVSDGRFDGPADGESAFKEGADIEVENCYFNLRYPFWHDRGLKITYCELTELCRAAIWYSERVDVKNTSLHGIKALRECHDVKISGCDIVSPEFGWSTMGIDMENTKAESEYFMMRSANLSFTNVSLKGKYSFQYIENGLFDGCNFDTKDAFWHAKNVIVKNSVIKGEYLAWYCENVTFDNCTIIGTQPLCYCKGLRLINCKMIDTDLAFEKSDVCATVSSPIISIKNPASGKIEIPSADYIIMDDKNAKCEIILTEPSESYKAS